MTDVQALVDGVVERDQRSLARAITVVENRTDGYRELVSALHRHPGDSAVVGVTGSPGVGKSTLVDALVAAYRARDQTVGVIAIDPSSPFSGGALLGDRVRLASAVGDPGVFVRSMSARGTHGGLAAATMDAVRVLSAAGTDVVIVETVGAGQSEVDVVTTADTVLLVTQPGSGDDVQALKAGILEIGDVYVVNKADREGADRTVRDLREMVEAADGLGSHRVGPDPPDVEWRPPIVETVATEAGGVDELLAAIDDHRAFLDAANLHDRKARVRVAETIRTHLVADVEALVDREIDRRGGLDALAERVVADGSDPYRLAADLLAAVVEPDENEELRATTGGTATATGSTDGPDTDE